MFLLHHADNICPLQPFGTDRFLALRLVPAERTLSGITAEHLFRRGAAPLITTTYEKDVHWQTDTLPGRASSFVDGLRVDTQSPVVRPALLFQNADTASSSFFATKT
jgi:hypothetical protein